MEAAVAVGEGHHARNTLRFFLSRWHTVAERRHKIRKVIERTECVCSFPAFCRLLRMGALTRWGVLLLPLVLCPVWAGTPNNNHSPPLAWPCLMRILSPSCLCLPRELRVKRHVQKIFQVWLRNVKESHVVGARMVLARGEDELEVLGEKAQGSLEKLQRERAAVQDSPWARDDWDSSDDDEEEEDKEEGGAAGDGSERRKTAV